MSTREKLHQLLHSNQPANDRLFVEIVHNDGTLTDWKPELLYLQREAPDDPLRNELAKLLERQGIGTRHHVLRLNTSDRAAVGGLAPWNTGEKKPETIAFLLRYWELGWRRGVRGYDVHLLHHLPRGPFRSEVFERFLKGPIRGHVFGFYQDEIERLGAVLKQRMLRNQTFVFRACHFTRLPAVFGQIIRTATYQPARPDEPFPAWLFTLTSCVKMVVRLHSATALPDDWSALPQLEELTFDGQHFVFDNFDFVDTLPQLKRLHLTGLRVRDERAFLRPRTVPIDPKFPVRFAAADVGNYFRGVAQLGAAVHKTKFSDAEKRHLLRALLQQPETGKTYELPRDECLQLLTVNHPGVRKRGRRTLTERTTAWNDLPDQKTVLLLGKTSRPRNETRRRLEQADIAYTTNPADPNLNCVVIAKSPPYHPELAGREFHLLQENQLYDHLPTETEGFLAVPDATPMADNVRALLEAEDANAVRIGLETLKTGGLPEAMIGPVLVVSKTHADAKVRNLAKKILRADAPAAWRPLVEEPTRFPGIGTSKRKESDVRKRLLKIERATSRREAVDLAFLLYERFGSGLRYVLKLFTRPGPTRTRALLALLDGTHFNFRRGLNYTDWRGVDPARITFYPMRSDIALPMDVLDLDVRVESMDLHNSKFHTLPRDFGRFVDLRRLDMSFNDFGALPASFKELQQLEELDLRRNRFTQVPPQLRHLPRLRRLDLREQIVKYQPVTVEGVEELRAALPNCEVLT